VELEGAEGAASALAEALTVGLPVLLELVSK